MKKQLATNPPLATNLCIPDVEAHVWEDGRLYLYGSYDIAGKENWCSGIHHVYSTDDMLTWVDHGVAFSVDDIKWTQADTLYAPECAFYKGMYYLYYCLPGGQCGVAKSDKPYGPFEDLGQIEGVDGIDPAVLVDDDGQPYLYWGQFDNVRVAKLRDNMKEIIPETVTQPLSVAEHEFHEGASVRKWNGRYYFVFTDTHRHGNMATSQGYAVSDNPMSGFVYKNVLIDNFGCDPGTWNNHGSIECFKGQWYMFYHRATHNGSWSRQLWIEPLQMDKNGDFAEVKMTSSGAAWTLPATETIMGCQACEVTGGACIAADADSAHDFALCAIRDGSTATWRYIAFGGENRFSVKMKTGAVGRVELYLDGWYRETMKVTECDGYTVFTAPVAALRGTHTVELKFFGRFENAVLDELTFFEA